MPKKVPLTSIGVTRDGKTVFPPIGEPFEFSAKEIAGMDAEAKTSGKPLYREPRNEVPAEDETKKKAAAEKAAAEEEAKKKANSGKSDDL